MKRLYFGIMKKKQHVQDQRSLHDGCTSAILERKRQRAKYQVMKLLVKVNKETHLKEEVVVSHAHAGKKCYMPIM